MNLREIITKIRKLFISDSYIWRKKFNKQLKEFKKSGEYDLWINKLWKTPNNSLAKIYCELNSFIFPDELSDIKPEWYDKEGRASIKAAAFWNIISEHIIYRVGEFEVNRYWNCVQRIDKMTPEEHLAWWFKHKSR